MALQVQHRVEHQLARAVVGDLATAIDPEQGRGRVGRIEAKKGGIGAAAEGVAGVVLQHQQRLGAGGIRQQALLQLPLPVPRQGKGTGPAAWKQIASPVVGFTHRS